ncbi:galactokinase family protein [Thermocladium modestius]|nr:galactokinase family protein [Thermocladium modestius]
MKSRAPGRVDLFNTHQDYKGLPVVPAAINLRTEVEGREAPGRVKVESMDLGERDEVDADSEFTGRWSDYVIAALRAMRRRGMRVGGAELIVRSGIPMGAGLGSSSALLVAIIKWFGASLGAGLTRGELAELAFEAENAELGIPCGRLDQYASAFGGLIALETRPPYSVEELGVKDLSLAVVDSGVKHRTSNIHSERQRELRGALRALGEAMGRNLDFPLDRVDWDWIGREAVEYLDSLSDVQRRRIEFTIRMNQSTKAVLVELRKPKPSPRIVGRAMNEQHEMLRDLYDVSIPEIEAIRNKLIDLGALGAKLSGAGMGGSVVALFEDAAAAARAVEGVGSRSWVVSVEPGADVIP